MKEKIAEFAIGVLVKLYLGFTVLAILFEKKKKKHLRRKDIRVIKKHTIVQHLHQ
ncbi:MAG: hypothetical protein JSS64_11260 [Bacteroidetes bacterium]|nr:hypothetical protein [Bacteroidota bacterium]